MPASVYKLVFRDPNLKKLVPNRLQIVGTCKLYLVHLDTKKLIDTTFYVVNIDGSILLS